MYSTGNKTVFKEAATVILVRPSQTAGWKIFLARRHHKQPFMAGAYVFPGGQMEDADMASQWRQCIYNDASFNPGRQLRDENLSGEKALGYFICGIRETFEEVGILLGGNEKGEFVSFHKKDVRSKYNDCRLRLAASKITFKEIIAKENVLLFPDKIVAYAHWITPEFEKMRFDTRFFLAKLPPEQRPVADAIELTESLWVAPKNALEMHSRKEIMLMPPTLKTIEELSAFAGIDELFAAAAPKEIYPILPQLSGKCLLLPHDPDYSIAGYKRPPDTSIPSRITSENGVWKTAHYKNDG